MTQTGASHLLGTLHRPMQLSPGPSGRVWYTAFARVPFTSSRLRGSLPSGNQPLLFVFPPHVVSPLKQPSVRFHV